MAPDTLIAARAYLRLLSFVCIAATTFALSLKEDTVAAEIRDLLIRHLDATYAHGREMSDPNGARPFDDAFDHAYNETLMRRSLQKVTDIISDAGEALDARPETKSLEPIPDVVASLIAGLYTFDMGGPSRGAVLARGERATLDEIQRGIQDMNTDLIDLFTPCDAEDLAPIIVELHELSRAGVSSLDLDLYIPSSSVGLGTVYRENDRAFFDLFPYGECVQWQARLNATFVTADGVTESRQYPVSLVKSSEKFDKSKSRAVMAGISPMLKLTDEEALGFEPIVKEVALRFWDEPLSQVLATFERRADEVENNNGRESLVGLNIPLNFIGAFVPLILFVLTSQHTLALWSFANEYERTEKQDRFDLRSFFWLPLTFQHLTCTQGEARGKLGLAAEVATFAMYAAMPISTLSFLHFKLGGLNKANTLSSVLVLLAIGATLLLYFVNRRSLSRVCRLAV